METEEEAAQLEQPSPGLYKQTMTITKFEVPGAAPEMAQQMQAVMGQAQENTFCMTEQMAGKGFREMFERSASRATASTTAST